jgi:hypothetical protein
MFESTQDIQELRVEKSRAQKNKWNYLHRKIETIDKLERKHRYEFINKHLGPCIKYLNTNNITLRIVIQ